MGIELHGLNPKNHFGKIHRNSIWIWHPMWNYLELNYKDTIKEINGHANNGDIVTKEISNILSEIILNDCNNQKINKFCLESILYFLFHFKFSLSLAV